MNLLLWEITDPRWWKIRYQTSSRFQPSQKGQCSAGPKKGTFSRRSCQVDYKPNGILLGPKWSTNGILYIDTKKNIWRKRTTRPLTEAVKYSSSSLQKYPKMEKKLHPDEEKKLWSKLHPLFRERWLVTISVRGWRWKKSSNFRPPKLVIWRLFHAIISWRDRFFEPTGMMREQLSMTFKKIPYFFTPSMDMYCSFACFLWASRKF